MFSRICLQILLMLIIKVEVGQQIIIFRFDYIGRVLQGLGHHSDAITIMRYVAFEMCYCFCLDHRSCLDTVIYVSRSAFCDDGQHVIVNFTAHS